MALFKVKGLSIHFFDLKPEVNPRAVILILHGWGSKAERWQEVGELLKRNDYRVIIPDLPGFGNSEKPKEPWGLDDYCNFIEVFRESLNLDKFYLLGHSFGDSLAIKCALRFPERIEKLFLVASAGIRKETLKKKILARISKLFKFFSFLPFYSAVRKAFYKYFIKKSDYPYTEGVMKKTFLKIINEDLSATLSSIKVPTVAIWGAKDDVIPLKDACFFQDRIKNSKLEIIPEGDHDLERKLPKELVQKILENL